MDILNWIPSQGCGVKSVCFVRMIMKVNGIIVYIIYEGHALYLKYFVQTV